jgi:hypothetical protein
MQTRKRRFSQSPSTTTTTTTTAAAAVKSEEQANEHDTGTRVGRVLIGTPTIMIQPKRRCLQPPAPAPAPTEEEIALDSTSTKWVIA